MKNIAHTRRLTLLATTLATVFGQAFANDEITALITPDNTLSIGVGQWSDDRPQQGIYDGLRGRNLMRVDIDTMARDKASGHSAAVVGHNLGLTSPELQISFGRQGDYGVVFDYNVVTRTNPLTFNTTLQGIGTTTLVVSSGTGANAQPVQTVTLGTTREGYGLKIGKNITPEVELGLNMKTEDKNGTRQWGRGGQPEFAVEPINSKINQVEAIASYTTDAIQVSGGYYGSWFDNANTLVDSYYRGANLSSVNNHIYLSLPLDNQSQQFFLNGAYKFSPTTRASVKLSRSKATQDEHLPTADITGLASTAAPTDIRGKIVTTIAQASLTSRPLPRLSLLASLRHQNVDDETPVLGIVFGSTNVHNTPHSFKTSTGKIEGTYALLDGYTVTAGADLSKQDRSYPLFEAERYVPFRNKVDENTVRLQLRRNLSETVNGSISYVRSDRDGSEYLAGEAETVDEINPIHIADRTRDKFRLVLDWTAMKNLSVQFVAENSSDEYKESASRPFGLHSGDGSLYSVDASYVIGENWSINAWFSRDQSEAEQLNGRWSRTDATYTTEVLEAENHSHLKDTGDTLGLGLRGNASSNLRFGLDAQYTRNKSEYRNTVALTGQSNPGSLGYTTLYATSSGVTAVSLPDIENKLTRIKLFAEYSLSKYSDLRFDLIQEHWRTDDWSWQFSNGGAFTYGASGTNTTDGTAVIANGDQKSTFVGARYIVRFQ